MRGFDHIKPMLAFFVPLALTALLTTVTHTLFNAGLGRLAQPEIFMSAFAVAKSLMHLFESPITMLRQTYTALVTDPQSMKQVRKFCTRLIIIVGILFAIFIYSPIAKLILTKIMNLSGDTLSAAIVILRILFFFPIFSAIRNYYQGILIKFKATRMVTFSTIGRFIYVNLFVLVIGKITSVSGSVLAGLMFLTALMVEMLILIFGTKVLIGNPYKKILYQNPQQDISKAPSLSYRIIFSFIGPLIIMGIIRSLNTPIVNAGLGQTFAPELALATYSVGWGLGNIAVSPLGSFHQIPISFLSSEKDNRPLIKKFALLVASFSALVIALMGFTDLGSFLLKNWIYAPADIIKPSVEVLRWMVLLPFFVIIREYYWGLLMYRRETKHLGTGKIVNVISLAIAMLILSFLDLSNPALVGVIGMIVCEITEIIFLFYVAR